MTDNRDRLAAAVDAVLLRYVNRPFGQAEALACKADILAAAPDLSRDADECPDPKCRHLWMFHSASGCSGRCGCLAAPTTPAEDAGCPHCGDGHVHPGPRERWGRSYHGLSRDAEVERLRKALETVLLHLDHEHPGWAADTARAALIALAEALEARRDTAT